jgi:hypothetical protein
MSEDGIFCRVVEYEISWPVDLKERVEDFMLPTGPEI